MRVKPHHHPCQHCGAKTECGGTWEENYDGWPEVICREFHQDGGINPDWICEGCQWKKDDGECEECGVWGDEPHDKTCAKHPDNYTGPSDDPDGPWGGGFAENH